MHGKPLQDTLLGAVACELGLLFCYGGLLCGELLPLLPREAAWYLAAKYSLLILFTFGLLAGLAFLNLGLGAWLFGARLPLFLPSLLWGVVDRRIFDEDFRDPSTCGLWRLHLYLLPPVVLVAAATWALGG